MLAQVTDAFVVLSFSDAEYAHVTEYGLCTHIALKDSSHVGLLEFYPCNRSVSHIINFPVQNTNIKGYPKKIEIDKSVLARYLAVFDDKNCVLRKEELSPINDSEYQWLSLGV